METINHIFELCQIGPSSTAGFVCTTYYQPCTQAKIIQSTFLVSNVSWEPVCKHNTNIKATLPQTSRAIKALIFSVSNTCTQAVVLYFHEIDFMKMILSWGAGEGDPSVLQFMECNSSLPPTQHTHNLE